MSQWPLTMIALPIVVIAMTVKIMVLDEFEYFSPGSNSTGWGNYIPVH